MTNKDKLFMIKVRLHQLKNNGKNLDSPGVVNKLERRVRLFERRIVAEQEIYLLLFFGNFTFLNFFDIIYIELRKEF